MIDPAGLRIGAPVGLVAAEDRLRAKLDIGPTPPRRLGLRGPCQVWTASTNRSGYGQFSVRTGTMLAHHVSYRLYVGDIPAGMHVHHRCERITCCNPCHLELIPESEHIAAHNRKRSKRQPKVLHVRRERRDEKVYTVTYLAPAPRTKLPRGRLTRRGSI